jgi:hypothetical protein
MLKQKSNEDGQKVMGKRGKKIDQSKKTIKKHTHTYA